MALHVQPSSVYALAEIARRYPGFLMLTQNVNGMHKIDLNTFPELQLSHLLIYCPIGLSERAKHPDESVRYPHDSSSTIGVPSDHATMSMARTF